MGILRAIGVKKIDIYKMFLGEILAITIISGTIGITFSFINPIKCAYILTAYIRRFSYVLCI